MDDTCSHQCPMNPSEIELGGKLGDPEVNVLRLRYDGKRQILGFRIVGF